MIVQIKRGPSTPVFTTDMTQVTGVNKDTKNIIDGQLAYDNQSNDLFIGNIKDKIKGGTGVIKIGGLGFAVETFKDNLENYPTEVINAIVEAIDWENHPGDAGNTPEAIDRIANFKLLTDALAGFLDDNQLTGAGLQVGHKDIKNGLISWNRWGQTPSEFVSKLIAATTPTDIPAGIINYYPTMDSNNRSISGLIDYTYLRRDNFDSFLNNFSGFVKDDQRSLELQIGLADKFVSQETNFSGNARIEFGESTSLATLQNKIKHTSAGISISNSFKDSKNKQRIKLEDGTITLGVLNDQPAGSEISDAGIQAIIRQDTLEVSRRGAGTGAALTVGVAGDQSYLKLTHPTEGIDEAAVRWDQLQDVQGEVDAAEGRLDTAERKITTLFGLAHDATFVAYKKAEFSDIEALPGSSYYHPNLYNKTKEQFDKLNLSAFTIGTGFNDQLIESDWFTAHDLINKTKNKGPGTFAQPLKGNGGCEDWVSGIISGKDIWQGYLNSTATRDALSKANQSLVEAAKEYVESKEETVWRPRNGTQYMVQSFAGLTKVSRPWKFWCWDFNTEYTLGTNGDWNGTNKDITLSDLLNKADAPAACKQLATWLVDNHHEEIAIYEIESTDVSRQGKVWYNNSASFDPTTGRPYFMDYQYSVDRVAVPDHTTITFEDGTGELRVHPDFVLDQGSW